MTQGSSSSWVGSVEFSSPWDPSAAVERCPAIKWHGDVWRGHRQAYQATSDDGSGRASGRYHRAPDCFPHQRVWRALYTSLLPETAVLEVARNYPASSWPPKNYRFTELRVTLSVVRDCRDPAVLGLGPLDLCDDSPDDDCHTRTWKPPQSLAEAAIRLSAEAIIVPSCSLRGSNLIVLTENMRPTSSIEETGKHFDPRFSRE